MKAHPEFYKKYTKSLGRLDKKSALVQKLLPKYAFDLFEKGDEKYIEAISLMAKNLKDNFFKGKEAAIIKKFKYDSEGKTVSSIEKVLRYKFLSYILTYISDLESITSVVTTDFKLKKIFTKNLLNLLGIKKQ